MEVITSWSLLRGLLRLLLLLRGSRSRLSRVHLGVQTSKSNQKTGTFTPVWTINLGSGAELSFGAGRRLEYPESTHTNIAYLLKCILSYLFGRAIIWAVFLLSWWGGGVGDGVSVGGLCRDWPGNSEVIWQLSKCFSHTYIICQRFSGRQWGFRTF